MLQLQVGKWVYLRCVAVVGAYLELKQINVESQGGESGDLWLQISSDLWFYPLKLSLINLSKPEVTNSSKIGMIIQGPTGKIRPPD